MACHKCEGEMPKREAGLNWGVRRQLGARGAVYRKQEIMRQLTHEEQQDIVEKAEMVTRMAVRVLVLNEETEESNMPIMQQAIAAAAGALSMPDNEEGLRELSSILNLFTQRWAQKLLAEIVEIQINEED